MCLVTPGQMQQIFDLVGARPAGNEGFCFLRVGRRLGGCSTPCEQIDHTDDPTRYRVSSSGFQGFQGLHKPTRGPPPESTASTPASTPQKSPTTPADFHRSMPAPDSDALRSATR